MLSDECITTLSAAKRTVTPLFSSPHLHTLNPAVSLQLAGLPMADVTSL